MQSDNQPQPHPDELHTSAIESVAQMTAPLSKKDIRAYLASRPDAEHLETVLRFYESDDQLANILALKTAQWMIGR